MAGVGRLRRSFTAARTKQDSPAAIHSGCSRKPHHSAASPHDIAHDPPASRLHPAARRFLCAHRAKRRNGGGADRHHRRDDDARGAHVWQIFGRHFWCRRISNFQTTSTPTARGALRRRAGGSWQAADQVARRKNDGGGLTCIAGKSPKQINQSAVFGPPHSADSRVAQVFRQTAGPLELLAFVRGREGFHQIGRAHV